MSLLVDITADNTRTRQSSQQPGPRMDQTGKEAILVPCSGQHCTVGWRPIQTGYCHLLLLAGEARTGHWRQGRTTPDTVQGRVRQIVNILLCKRAGQCTVVVAVQPPDPTDGGVVPRLFPRLVQRKERSGYSLVEEVGQVVPHSHHSHRAVVQCYTWSVLQLLQCHVPGSPPCSRTIGE